MSVRPMGDDKLMHPTLSIRQLLSEEGARPDLLMGVHRAKLKVLKLRRQLSPPESIGSAQFQKGLEEIFASCPPLLPSESGGFAEKLHNLRASNAKAHVSVDTCVLRCTLAVELFESWLRVCNAHSLPIPEAAFNEQT